MRMNILVCLAIALAFGAQADSAPTEESILKSLKTLSCAKTYEPTYKIMEIAKFQSYALKDGKLVKQVWENNDCPDGMQNIGSHCVAFLCSKTVSSVREKSKNSPG